MEKVEGPPLHIETAVDNQDEPAPPYPGPSLDNNAVNSLPPQSRSDGKPEPQLIAHTSDQTVYQKNPQQQNLQQDAQPSYQPVGQQYPQQYSNPADQQYLQPAQQQQQCIQYVPQQAQVVQPVNQVVVVQRTPTDAPGNMHCPHCQTTVVTSIEHKIGFFTWLTAGLLFIIGCWPCFIIPFFVNICKDVQHSCPQCNNVLHTHKLR
ncbi:lipopolysaccharide-induced tumor necrosis factor-alpha factor homolog [Cyprinodon tularosa]|uniref:lipopolysaccharide-induced tumor necrosis factor-alpha factor homolog n=1 Tax=Cyprinodon tularosa TaxID=77115 RepID=UPI0018E20541|nr:lipopolysaccharide-induced tumor necrosis factor-alpha factor homolog [Cyprinodon tularosa]